MMGYLPNKWPTLSAPAAAPKLRALSLGVGVQSTTMALMASRGEIGPMPDCAIFANTGWEPRKVYEYLDYLRPLLAFPIIVVEREGADLGRYAMETAHLPLAGRSTVPFYTANPTGMMAKQCSKEWKTRVVTREVRRQLGLQPRQRVAGVLVEMWIGISKDEIVRVRTAEAAYIHNRHPLIEADMTRQDCIRWLKDRQYRVPPKSSCVFCPFRDNAAWVRMGRDEPDDFEQACLVDEAIRPGYSGMEGEAFVHRNRIPLRSLDLTQPTAELQFDFDEPCDGGCGF